MKIASLVLLDIAPFLIHYKKMRAVREVITSFSAYFHMEQALGMKWAKVGVLLGHFYKDE